MYLITLFCPAQALSTLVLSGDVNAASARTYEPTRSAVRTLVAREGTARKSG